ncbi:unnamed protein product [Lactuca saligna]|uniref:Uncharacterized protein n=1 Tax=Lactuca saligna TaxID=75948 RepID=A0AA35YRF5_LACSI|nr:unnamed protein product [Lactuca saligna]
MQEISSPLPESTPMDQDFESAIVEQELLPSEGAQAYGISFKAPDSGIANPISQSISERVVRPASNANLDTFLSSSPASAQERRKKQIMIEKLKGKMLVMKHSD